MTPTPPTVTHGPELSSVVIAATFGRESPVVTNPGTPSPTEVAATTSATESTPGTSAMPNSVVPFPKPEVIGIISGREGPEFMTSLLSVTTLESFKTSLASGEVTLLYPVRFPFTGLTAVSRPDVGLTDLKVEVKFRPAGTLRVQTGDLDETILHGFANTTKEVGYIIEGKVHWRADPRQFGHTIVITDRGRIVEIRTLKGDEE